MRILFLYSEIMGYTEALLAALKKNHNASIKLVHWDHKKVSDYRLVVSGNDIISRSNIDLTNLINLIDQYNPDLIYVSGWMDKLYLKGVKYAKKKGIKVVAGLDTPWTNSVKQNIASIFLRSYWKAHFDYFWVPGSSQALYAEKLGFAKMILKNLYSADVSTFQKAWNGRKKDRYPHRLLFVGRLIPLKGIEDLIEAFLSLTPGERSDWELVIVGNGPLEKQIPDDHSIRYLGFLEPQMLAHQMIDSGAFCLPSHWEPWGVVIHEAAAAGLPMILSDSCGAAETFLVEGENGFSFKSGEKGQLKTKLIQLFNLSDDALLEMGSKSHALSDGIRPEISARTLIEVIDEVRY